MSGSIDETRDQKGARSTLADLLNSVALPADIKEKSPRNVSSAVDDLERKGRESMLVEQGATGTHTGNGHSAPQEYGEAENGSGGQHRGASMNIWGEAKTGNSANDAGADAPQMGAASTAASTSAADGKGAQDASYAAGKWGAKTSTTEAGDAVSIKGRADGISIELGRGSWSELMEQLVQRLGAASGFFRGGKVTLNVGIRPLQESEVKQVCDVLERFGMTLGVVRSSSEQTCQAALALGLAANLDAADGIQAQAALTNHDALSHFVYRGNLRSGQILKRTETVLVLGDVNPGAQVISDGDILIWGRLRGIAHAGNAGDTNSIISALSMEPTQLRIADLIAVLPEENGPSWMGKLVSGREGLKRPEIAYIADEQIVVDPWDQSKPGGIMAYRR